MSNFRVLKIWTRFKHRFYICQLHVSKLKAISYPSNFLRFYQPFSTFTIKRQKNWSYQIQPIHHIAALHRRCNLLRENKCLLVNQLNTSGCQLMLISNIPLYFTRQRLNLLAQNNVKLSHCFLLLDVKTEGQLSKFQNFITLLFIYTFFALIRMVRLFIKIRWNEIGIFFSTSKLGWEGENKPHLNLKDQSVDGTT